VALPDFCNLGVMLRVILLVNGMLAAAVLVQSRAASLNGLLQAFLAAAAIVEPVLIASLALLCPLRRTLRPLGYAAGVVAIALLELCLVTGMRWVLPGETRAGLDALLRDYLAAAAVTGVVLYYFNLRERAFSPALAEARLAALQARIRPHFLFNSLTAVLSLIRSEPRRAEAALEDLADLFRVLLREQRQLVPLEDEIEICRRYLDIEALRLGDRLKIVWNIDAAATDTAMPPLILQPLVENAVHHGIEPAVASGEVAIRIARNGGEVEIEIVNPKIDDAEPDPHAARAAGSARPRNHMALDNVRERLALHFDVEARLETVASGGQYRVTIVVPYRRYVERATGEGR
jgi:two-component system sensor histidine kinase AlgZ